MNSLSKASLVVLASLLCTLGVAQADPFPPFQSGPQVSAPVLVDVPREHIDPQTAPTLVHIPDSDIVEDVVLGKDKPSVSAKSIKAANGALLQLGCGISGGDLMLANLGEEIASGAKVKWQAAGAKGTVALPHGLRAGQKAKIEDAVAIDSGKCTAQVIL
jgi:hypothetical protein